MSPGDKITAVDGEPIASFEELQATVRESAGQPLVFVLTRDGETRELTVTPAASEIEDRFGNVHQVGLIGVSRAEWSTAAATRSWPCSRPRPRRGG